MTPEEADYRLEEWARWQRADPLTMSWPTSTPFGRQIKPDPRPGSIAIDEQRALETDKVLAKMPRRYRFIVRLHYLDTGPIDAKAKRMGLGRKGYKALIAGIQRTIAFRLDQPRNM